MFAQHMSLESGMSLCEMGSANGAVISRLGQKVMPGGKLYATAPLEAELAATRTAVADAGLGGVATYKATDASWAPGLLPGSCDVIYSRMVYHMISKDVVAAYIPQWAAALKPGGKLFMADHNPLDGGIDGPRRPIGVVLGIGLMPVVPSLTEIDEIVAGGFELLDGPIEWPYYSGGYAALYAPA